MDKKSKIDFFVRLTRHVAKEEIKNKQEALGRELTKEEKQKIIKKHANIAKRKVTATVLAATIGITGFVSGFAVGRLTAGDEQKESVTTTTKEDFKDGLKVEPSTQTPEQEQEVDEVLEQVKKEINGLDSKEDILDYFKQLYAQEYEEVMGKSISASSVKILQTEQSYVYQLEDGQIVTHGDYPAITEGKIEADGLSHERADARKVYIVKDSFGNELDGMSINGKKVIPGNSYDKLKDSPSPLEKIGSGATYNTFKLYDLYRQLENKPGNTFILEQITETEADLAIAVANYKTKKLELQKETQQSTTQENEVSNPTIEDDGR